jgi:hypothetical protein
MKAFKFTILFVAVLTASTFTNQCFSNYVTKSYAYFRVRTVPGTSDQKKKENEQSTTPKQQSTSSSKENSGIFCSESSNLRTRLAVTNGGAPK